MAIERLQELITTVGIQATSKKFPVSEWDEIRQRYVEAAPAESLRISERFQKSIDDWLEDRIRYPRLKEPESHK